MIINKLTLLTYSDYVLIMSLLNSSIDIKNFFNSLIETGELMPPKNIFDPTKTNLNDGFNFDKSSNKYEKQVLKIIEKKTGQRWIFSLSNKKLFSILLFKKASSPAP